MCVTWQSVDPNIEGYRQVMFIVIVFLGSIGRFHALSFGINVTIELNLQNL